MDLITPGFGLVFWTALTFIFLLVILRKFAWNPILGAVSDREEGIKTALASAENARKEMENLTADNDRILKEARAERQAMLKEARDLKSSMIESVKTEAKAVIRGTQFLTNCSTRTASPPIDVGRKLFEKIPER